MNGRDWPHDKTGIAGKLEVNSLFRLTSGRRLYLKEEKTSEKLSFGQPNNQDSLAQKLSAKKWRKLVPYKEFPSSLPVAKLVSADIEVTMSLGDNLNQNDVTPSSIVQEIRVQVPPEMFDLSRLVCGTYVDSRLLVLRGVNGSALLFTRSIRLIEDQPFPNAVRPDIRVARSLLVVASQMILSSESAFENNFCYTAKDSLKDF
ncbi:hypothetical protein OIU78_029318 [Salix suchowensis]|nr:hypothetical protein OIU78_029318 [Salix suchowensis]